MRNLTIRRKKSFIGCLAKVKIYIEDENGDTVINGAKCRLLGKIKNNEVATYEIGNGSYKLFSIYDKVSKGYCNDCYIIPAGEEDIEVSGVVKFSPFMGNPFLFDGNMNEETFNNREQNKKKAMMIMIPLMVTAVVGGFLIGYYLL